MNLCEQLLSECWAEQDWRLETDRFNHYVLDVVGLVKPVVSRQIRGSEMIIREIMRKSDISHNCRHGDYYYRQIPSQNVHTWTNVDGFGTRLPNRSPNPSLAMTHIEFRVILSSPPHMSLHLDTFTMHIQCKEEICVLFLFQFVAVPFSIILRITNIDTNQTYFYILITFRPQNNRWTNLRLPPFRPTPI